MSDLYNRELSWLQFNDRVLQEAQDPTVPLMQRLRFLGIYSNNQDEFIKVRVANLIRYTELKTKHPLVLSGGYGPAELLDAVNHRVHESQNSFRQTYADILGELQQEGVYVVDQTHLSAEQLAFCREYFSSVVSVRLIPLMLRKSVQIPFLPDGKIYLAVKMTARKGAARYAILQMPVSDACPRFVVLPSEAGRSDVIFLDDLIRLFLDEIFFMFSYTEISAHTFKIVRDAAMVIDHDVSKSIAQKMSQSISKREKGRPIRLVYDQAMPEDVLDTIAYKLGFRSAEQIEPGGRYHLMRDLMKFPRVRPELESHTPRPLQHPLIDPFDSIFRVINKQDILLCYPYQTFKHFIDLLREAAVDPKVEAISITLYRTASHSKVINALLNAARNGKKVTALVELKARFDEERNIDNMELLQKGGVRVIHSLEGLKVHSKLLLVERKDSRGVLKGYTYVGTGNFNESTTEIYSDFGLFTADSVVAADARRVFDFLDNTHQHPTFKKLLVSPYYMRERVVELIENEIKQAKKGRPASIDAKFNALTDPKMIAMLYKASQAGVQVRLLVRGACCLTAGVEGLSDGIEVRSIVDKYLEHARLILCHNNGKPTAHILSADLMTRNLDRRVEVGMAIEDPKILATLGQYFHLQWSDNVKARLVEAPYQNHYVVRKEGEPILRSQDALFQLFEHENQ